MQTSDQNALEKHFINSQKVALAVLVMAKDSIYSMVFISESAQCVVHCSSCCTPGVCWLEHSCLAPCVELAQAGKEPPARPAAPNITDGGVIGKLVADPVDDDATSMGSGVLREKYEMVLNEIIETERSYVEALSGVITVCSLWCRAEHHLLCIEWARMLYTASCSASCMKFCSSFQIIQLRLWLY